MERFNYYNVPADLMHKLTLRLSLSLCIKSAGTLFSKMMMFGTAFYVHSVGNMLKFERN